ncbi:glucoamylase family protein [Flavitalea sp. BT771]|uniref:glucoamylase family protein n=1 Tax=Flavitalea sp. BT771 TaxID=3063329 RepID=UPI0026E3F36E|nr:glucoamylase family protein [Flavitalea sp. BT771]MDO6433535.1 glucoamylase family protein [Flavitalea sp. BT771]MDV6222560.1 glucoamylase family protein [Flavitalea sp. BT771]
MKKKHPLLLLTLTLGLMAMPCSPSRAQQSAAPRSQAHSSQLTAHSSLPVLSDSALLELTEKQTFKYFWDFAHPISGLARERSNSTFDYGPEVVTTGGSGFGIMAIIVGAERKFITRDQAVDRLSKILRFLVKADSYHGIFPHWLNGETGKTIPFSRKDDGADLVETSYLLEGLLCARQYFNGSNSKETELRNKINWLWNEAEFSWHTRGGMDLLYWHWSPNNGWSMNFELRGWNETLITYILAASSPRYAIDPKVYHHCWAESNHFYNGRSYYGITLPLGFPYGGPLFFAHYSFLGLDPRGLKDQYADYWEQNKNHTLINREHCVRNPNHFKGYGPDCWGLTASDNYEGYDAHSPDNDLAVITPSAALSSFPYTPEYSMQALKYFYNKVGDKVWGQYGFTDAFSEEKNWYATEYLAIDQGPEIVMIENYRSGLLWRLFMSCPEIQTGLRRLGFQSPWLK